MGSVWNVSKFLVVIFSNVADTMCPVHGWNQVATLLCCLRKLEGIQLRQLSLQNRAQVCAHTCQSLTHYPQICGAQIQKQKEKQGQYYHWSAPFLIRSFLQSNLQALEPPEELVGVSVTASAKALGPFLLYRRCDSADSFNRVLCIYLKLVLVCTDKCYFLQACIGSKSCSIGASASTFGDPCRGVAKSLAVEASCA